MNQLLMLSIVLGFGAEVWPGFRGDGSSGTTAKNLPVKWTGMEDVAWRINLPGYGQSSPVVWKDRVFVTAVEGAEKERCIVLAVDIHSGDVLWEKRFTASQKGKNNPSVSRAAPTPVVDQKGLYVFFESGDLIGMSHEGTVKWQRSLTDEYGEFQNHHGLGSSLTQTENALFVLVEHRGPSYLLAVDKMTGKNIWKTERESGLSWTSPIIAEHEGRKFVLVSSNGSLTSYDARTGKELWMLESLAGNLIPSPAIAGNIVVVGAGQGGFTFDRQAAAKSNCAVRLTMEEGKPGYEILWRGQKAVAHHASPVVHQGCVYLLTKVGVLYCRDLETGKQLYVERVHPCWATPIAVGDYLYLFGKDGVTTVIESGSKFREVATNRLWSDEELKFRREIAEKRPESQFPQLPSQGREEMEAMLREAVGDVVYGVAAVDERSLFAPERDSVAFERIDRKAIDAIWFFDFSFGIWIPIATVRTTQVCQCHPCLRPSFERWVSHHLFRR